MEDVLVGLLDQLLKQTQGHDADLWETYLEAMSTKEGTEFQQRVCETNLTQDTRSLLGVILTV